jgi:hypothetical protein
VGSLDPAAEGTQRDGGLLKGAGARGLVATRRRPPAGSYPGSRPCPLRTCCAAGAVRKVISALAASLAVDALWIAPENTVRY